MTRDSSLAHLATLLAGAGMVAVITACAAQQPASQPDTTHELPRATPDREEILRLESEMRQWRVELGLKPSPAGAMAANGAAAEVCEGLDECKDACKLAEAICQNKDRICEIARDLSDDWATNKCEDARRSCDEAKVVCDCCKQRERNGLLPAQPCAPQSQPQP